MTEWYYARGGQQSGPVTFEQLGALARSGGLDAFQDLIWTSSMKDWTPAGQIPGLFVPAIPGTPPADPSNPYAAPQSAWTEPAPLDGDALLEIPPGSEPIDVMACVKRAFDLTKREFGTILLVGVVYFAVFMALSMVIGIVTALIQAALFGISSNRMDTASAAGAASAMMAISLITQLIIQVFSLYIGLGLTRIGLNLVAGKPVSVGLLFSQGDKLLRAIGATFLFMVMAGVGFLLLIVPGIYITLRYGQYMVAIVDRNLGVIDSLAYSSSITTQNRWNVLLLGLLATAICFAGMLACGIGLIFAAPVAWLSYLVAYRWMQYGHRVTLDHPGTTTPLLSGLP